MTNIKHSAFISDLHLSPDLPDRNEMFFNFLETIACNADRLFILGDLFDFFVGEDTDRLFYSSIKNALVKATHDCEIFFLPGNRDFLATYVFFKDTKIKILKDFTVINIHTTPTLLCHGDLLPTKTPQTSYRLYRRFSNYRIAQAAFLLLPPSTRQHFAKRARLKSEKKKGKTFLTSNHYLNEQKIAKMCHSFGVSQIIHGHFHHAELKTINCIRKISLNEWRSSPHFLIIGEDHVELY